MVTLHGVVAPATLSLRGHGSNTDQLCGQKWTKLPITLVTGSSLPLHHSGAGTLLANVGLELLY